MEGVNRVNRTIIAVYDSQGTGPSAKCNERGRRILWFAALLPFRPTALAGRGKSPPRLFSGRKTSGFHGSCAPGIAFMRPSRLFIHSLLATAVATAM